MAINPDVKLATETLFAKGMRLTPLFQYYVGNQPIKYAADRLRDIFQNQSTTFVENWCAVVVDSTLDRLELREFDVTDDESASLRLNDLLSQTRMFADSDAIMRAALVSGESYVVAWADGSDVEAYYNDPRNVHLWTDAEKPREKRMAAKWWQQDDGVWRLNLFYPERIERYFGSALDGASVHASMWQLESEERNPWGVIPVFQLYKDRYFAGGELTNVLPLQDAINKLFADMMVAAEYGAFKQRYVITNSDTSKLRNSPNEIWELPPGGPGEQPTAAGEFSTTDLGNYLDATDRLASRIATITRTPKHYLFSTGGDPSGEALNAMEAPLIRKVQQYQERFGQVWAELASFLLLLDGSQVDELSITPGWAPAATIQPKTQAEIRQLSVAAGIPLETHLKRAENWTDEEVDEMQEVAANAAQANTNLGAELLTAFDRGQA